MTVTQQGIETAGETPADPAGGVAATPIKVMEPGRGLLDFNLGEVWRYRELLFFLIWREVKVRYKQTLLGAAWAILQPLLTMVIFSLIFGRFANIPSDDLPYPIFTYTALLPWQYFASAIDRSGNSLVANARLISKVYFPRLIIPLAAVATPIVDFALAFLVLLGMMAFYQISLTWNALLLPAFLLLAILTALAASLWLSALNVKYRDVRHAIPFLVQAWMYASPIVYSISIVPKRWRMLYSLNPIVGVVEGFRWALLGKESPDLLAMAISTVAVLLMLISGLIYFRRMDRTFADIV